MTEIERVQLLFKKYPEIEKLASEHDHIWAYFELVHQGKLTLQEAMVGIIRRLARLDEWGNNVN